jgi:hypothetical protein
MPGKLQSFRVDKVDVCGGDGEDDTVRLRDVFGDEVAGLLFDVGRLVTDGYLQLLASFIRPKKGLHHQPL